MTATEDDYLAELKEIDERCGTDPEAQHGRYDDLMYQALLTLGWERLARAYCFHNAAGDEDRHQSWWYA